MARSRAALARGDGAAVFAALGDPTRLSVVARLSAEGPLSIARLAEGTAVTRQAVAKHLQVLAGAGLVSGAREGRESVWTLDRRGLSEAQLALETISKGWDATILRLKAYVERQS